MKTTQAEIEQRYANVREAAQAAGVDAVVVSGSEYSGFEGAVRYLSGFRILHRYAYVVVPVDGDPAVVFPREARWVAKGRPACTFHAGTFSLRVVRPAGT